MKRQDKSREDAYVGKPDDPELATKRRKDWRKIKYKSDLERERRGGVNNSTGDEK